MLFFKRVQNVKPLRKRTYPSRPTNQFEFLFFLKIQAVEERRQNPEAARRGDEELLQKWRANRSEKSEQNVLNNVFMSFSRGYFFKRRFIL